MLAECDSRPKQTCISLLFLLNGDFLLCIVLLSISQMFLSLTRCSCTILGIISVQRNYGVIFTGST